MQKTIKWQRPLRLKPPLFLGALVLVSQITSLPAHADAYGPAIYIQDASVESSGTVYTLRAGEGPYVFGTVADDDGINRIIVQIRRYSDGAFWTGNNWQYPSAVVPTTYTPNSTRTYFNAYNGPPAPAIVQGEQYLVVVEAVDLLGNRNQVRRTVTGTDTQPTLPPK